MALIEQEVHKSSTAALSNREIVPLRRDISEIDSVNPTNRLSFVQTYSASKTVATGLMDIALLSANANQLRFLLTYNHDSSTFYCSLALVILSLVLQVLVGIGIIFKGRMNSCAHGDAMKETILVGLFLITVINVLLAAFTTTDGKPESIKGT